MKTFGIKFYFVSWSQKKTATTIEDNGRNRKRPKSSVSLLSGLCFFIIRFISMGFIKLIHDGEHALALAVHVYSSSPQSDVFAKTLLNFAGDHKNVASDCITF